MSTSTPAPSPGGASEPAPPAPSLSGGGNDHDVHDNNDDFSPLLDLLQRFPDLVEQYVLERLDPTARAALARTGSAFQDAVYPRSIFPVGIPRAQTSASGRQALQLPPLPEGVVTRSFRSGTFSEPPSGWRGPRRTGARGTHGRPSSPLGSETCQR